MPLPIRDNFLGYLEYNGELVAQGIIDARAAATALNGFDSALRYFVAQEEPRLATIEFPIPVQVERGSWIAVIPLTIGQWILTGGGVVTTAYLATAAKKIAENDFKDVHLRDVFRSALRGLQWFIRIGKHLGSIAERRISNLRWRNNNEEVGIPNANGELLFVPRREFERFINAPLALASAITKVVETERTMTIARREGDIVEEVTVNESEKKIFYVEEDEAEVLFPELVLGQRVQLDGLVTRGNETANSIGFKYNEHILTCYPRTGSIVRFKRHLFLRCRITGEISRADEHGGTSDPRPKIIFDGLQITEPDEQPLFREF